MRFQPSVFDQLLQPLCRRTFRAIVARHDGDAYDKCFSSWQHLVTLVYAQLSGASSLRALEAGWNANSQCHYHLDCGPLSRSTLADANHRRPPAIFAEVFAHLAGEAGRALRQDGMDMVRLIDSTPIQLGELLDWCTSNGRIRGLKMHVVYEHGRVLPRRIDITDANINDVEMGRAIDIEKSTTYVFDKAYCHYGWWTQIHTAGAVFVTRKKENARFKVKTKRTLTKTKGDGFTILDDHDVTHTSKSNAGAKLAIPIRLIRLRRDGSKAILTLITNDTTRPAVEIGALYKARWQIELLFRWLKQNLELSCFLGRSENAVRLQIYAAMIAFLLLRLATQRHGSKHTPIRFAELIGQKLMARRPIASIDKPPPANPHIRPPRAHPAQINLAFQ